MPLLLHVVVFLASFLLFQVELIASKAMLPGFGGSYLVWGVSVMIFQGLLLLGYSYAHLAGRLVRLRWFRLVVAAAPLVPLLFFPLHLEALTDRHPTLPFALDIAWTLLSSIGLAFFVLASLSVLLQRYLGSARLRQSANPYVLYATSNLGSFSGLLSYPLLVEPGLALGQQLILWQWLYGLGALLFLVVHVWAGQLPQTPAAAFAAPAPRRRAVWLLLSGAGSALFLAVTNLITFDIASAPLIWVLPLSLFLLSFVLTFKNTPWYPRWLRERLPLCLAIALLLYFLHQQSYTLPLPVLLGAHLLLLLLLCVICHGELNRTRPERVEELAAFYIYLSLGGFLGGVLVSWVIPVCSNSVLEYLAALTLLGLGVALAREERPAKGTLLAALAIAPVLLGWSWLLGRSDAAVSMYLAAGAGLALALIFFGIRRSVWAQAACLAIALLLAQHLEQLRPGEVLLEKHRNFYGIYTVFDKGEKRFLRHGTTLHGSQYLDAARRGQALNYYHASLPAGELLGSTVLPLERVGMVGLGAGALAAYGREGQEMVFYELDPYNEVVARRYFTYLEDCRADLELVFGDARLSLEQRPHERFSVLVVDAFNSDSIPLHLITVEAMQLYLERVQPDGVVLFHISNKFLDLRPVLRANAQRLGVHGLLKSVLVNVHPDGNQTIWAAISRSKGTAETLIIELGWQRLEDVPLRAIQPWTDRHSNIVAAFR